MAELGKKVYLLVDWEPRLVEEEVLMVERLVAGEERLMEKISECRMRCGQLAWQSSSAIHVKRESKEQELKGQPKGEVEVGASIVIEVSMVLSPAVVEALNHAKDL